MKKKIAVIIGSLLYSGITLAIEPSFTEKMNNYFNVGVDYIKNDFPEDYRVWSERQVDNVKDKICDKPIKETLIKEIYLEKEVEIIKEVIKPVEIIKEVIVEVPVEVIKIVEVIVEVPVEVIKIVEIIKEVIVEVPVEVIKIVEVVVEVPVEVIKIVEIIKEVPVEIIKIKTQDVNVSQQVLQEVVKEVPVQIKTQVLEKDLKVKETIKKESI